MGLTMDIFNFVTFSVIVVDERSDILKSKNITFFWRQSSISYSFLKDFLNDFS